jgi:hypothetical protein
MNYLDVLYAPVELATATDDQIAACVREWRNRQLAASDWTQLPDSPADQLGWAVYRQELRDMMQQSNDPKLIVFPAPPATSIPIQENV